jgi:transposase
MEISMPWPVAPKIELTAPEQEALASLLRAHKTPQQIVIRARIVLLAAEGTGNREIARRLKIRNKSVRRWRERWLSRPGKDSVPEKLADEPRSGRKAIFTAEQICAIIALACETPAEKEGAPPLSHWSQPDLATEAVRRNIVEKISPRSVGRFLKRGRPQAPSHPLLAQQKT